MGVVTGGGGGAAFNGGTITQPLVIDLSAAAGNTVPLTVKASYNNQSVDFLAVVNSDAGGMKLLAVDSGGIVGVRGPTTSQDGQLSMYYRDGATEGARLNGNSGVTAIKGSVHAQNATGYVEADGFTSLYAATSGALSTTTFSSGTGKQVDVNTDRVLIVPVTYNPTAGAAATCAIALSPDDVTYSTVATGQEPAGVALDNTVQVHTVVVPAGWFVKLTATNATIGTGTYY